VTSPRGKHGSGILCVAPPNPAEVQKRLRAASIIASLREGSIRLSPHFYNTMEEMQRVVEVLHHSIP
jgi:selenocysteine lyase/cysteine desulfurase